MKRVMSNDKLTVMYNLFDIDRNSYSKVFNKNYIPIILK